jgi:DNA-binding MarR family transcriptional regulator
MKRDSQSDRLSRSPIHLLHRAGQCAGDVFHAEMKDGDLTPRQLAVLVTVAHNEGLSQTGLVDRTGIDRSTLADIVRRMQRKGLLQRRRTREDARAYAVKLTDEGRRLLRVAEPLGKRVDEMPPVPDGPWKAFAEAKVLPDLSELHFIVRAITPPRRPRRFDARFFAADASAIAHKVDGKVGPDSELVELVWLPIAEAKSQDLPTITQVALDGLQARVGKGFGHDLPSPFYRMLHKKFVRAEL